MVKKVLIIGLSLNPTTFVGALRIRGLVKFLPEFGWEPIILTTESFSKIDSRINVIEVPHTDIQTLWKKKLRLDTNKTIKEKLDDPTYKNKKTVIDHIIYCFNEIFAYPDYHKTWLPLAVEEGKKIFNNNKIDAMISSSYPPTCHLIANKLHKLYHVPWLADFRDLWTQNHYYPHTRIRRLIEKKLEIKTISNAHSLITISSPLARKLQIIHKKPTYVIVNGFDPDEIVSSKIKLTKKFTITYPGVLYQGKRDPAPLFKVAEELIRQKIIDSKNIEIRFYGPKEQWLEKEIEFYHLTDIVNYYGILDRTSILKKERESQILLLLLWKHPEESGVYTGKLFEYLAAQRPIFVIGGPNDGVIKELLEDTQAGVYLTDIKEIKNNIQCLYHQYTEAGKVPYQGKLSKINKYSQREMAKKFAQTLNKIASDS